MVISFASLALARATFALRLGDRGCGEVLRWGASSLGAPRSGTLYLVGWSIRLRRIWCSVRSRSLPMISWALLCRKVSNGDSSGSLTCAGTDPAIGGPSPWMSSVVVRELLRDDSLSHRDDVCYGRPIARQRLQHRFPAQASVLTLPENELCARVHGPDLAVDRCDFA